MSDKYFIDTNIFVYANDNNEKIKQPIAKEIILQGIKNDNIVISTQVLSEFYVTVTRKIKRPLEPDNALREIELLRYIEIVELDFDLVVKAIRLSQNNKYSYWDSLIIAAAIQTKANILYSEDLIHKQTIENVTIINPFI